MGAAGVAHLSTLFSLSLYAHCYLAFFWRTDDFVDKLPYLFTYTYNLFLGLGQHAHSSYPISHLWSLSIEEQFYLLYPFVIFFCGKTTLRWLFVLIILLAIICRLLLLIYLPVYTSFSAEKVIGVIYDFSLSHFDAFLIGGSIAVFGFSNWSLSTRLKLFYGLMVAVLVGGLGVYLHQHNRFSVTEYLRSLGIANNYSGFYTPVWIYLILNLFFASIILLLTGKQWSAGWCRLFSRPPWLNWEKFHTACM